jgi:hypothetical protein
MIYLRAYDGYSGVGQGDGDFLSVAFYIFFREVSHVDVCFDDGIHWDCNFSFA